MKPGFKTTEFWLSLAAALVGALLAADVLPAESLWLKVAGMAAAALAAMGYTGARMVLKNTESKGAAIAAAAEKSGN